MLVLKEHITICSTEGDHCPANALLLKLLCLILLCLKYHLSFPTLAVPHLPHLTPELTAARWEHSRLGSIPRITLLQTEGVFYIHQKSMPQSWKQEVRGLLHRLPQPGKSVFLKIGTSRFLQQYHKYLFFFTVLQARENTKSSLDLQGLQQSWWPCCSFLPSLTTTFSAPNSLVEIWESLLQRQNINSPELRSL